MVRNIYIDPNGSDANDGSIDTPFKTLENAIRQIDVSETEDVVIHLREGIYEPADRIWIGGERAAQLTITSYDGETAILDGGRLESGALINVKNTSRVDILDFEIRNVSGHAIEVIDGHDVTIAGNTIHDTDGMGIRVRGYAADIAGEGDTSVKSTDIRIENNEVYQTNLSNAGGSAPNWGAGIQAWNAEGVTIAHNAVYENFGEGIGLSNVKNGQIVNNVTYDNFSVEIYLDNASHSEVRHNFVYNTGNHEFFRDGHPSTGIGLGNEVYDIVNGADYSLDQNVIVSNVIANTGVGIAYGTHPGIHAGGDDNYAGLKNTLIANNTIYRPSYEVLKIAYDPLTENVEFLNNIFYKPSDYGLNQIESVDGLVFGNNLWFGNDPGSASSPTDLPSVDPLFLDPGSDDLSGYGLSSESPAIDAGRELNELSSGTSPDIGALEYGEEPFVAGLRTQASAHVTGTDLMEAYYHSEDNSSYTISGWDNSIRNDTLILNDLTSQQIDVYELTSNTEDILPVTEQRNAITLENQAQYDGKYGVGAIALSNGLVVERDDFATAALQGFDLI